MLGHRVRHWQNIEPILDQSIVLAETALLNVDGVHVWITIAI